MCIVLQCQLHPKDLSVTVASALWDGFYTEETERESCHRAEAISGAIGIGLNLGHVTHQVTEQVHQPGEFRCPL